MKPDNWKWNDIWEKWENINRFNQIYIDETKEDGITLIKAESENGLYFLATFACKQQAKEWLTKFIDQ